MSDQNVEAPKIEFPCPNYPIKVIGNAAEDFPALVTEILKKHAPELDPGTLVTRDSSNGRFMSVQLLITATGIEQLQAIHEDLRATGRVQMVL